MKRFAGVLLVLAVFGAGYLFGACSGRCFGGSGGGMESAATEELPVAANVEMGEIKWYDDFDGGIIEQRVLDKETNSYVDNARAVPLTWILAVVLRNIEKEEKNLVFVVTNPEGKVLPAEEYRIYIRGYTSGGELSWAEDFPPILYP